MRKEEWLESVRERWVPLMGSGSERAKRIKGLGFGVEDKVDGEGAGV